VKADPRSCQFAAAVIVGMITATMMAD